MYFFNAFWFPVSSKRCKCVLKNCPLFVLLTKKILDRKLGRSLQKQQKTGIQCLSLKGRYKIGEGYNPCQFLVSVCVCAQDFPSLPVQCQQDRKSGEIPLMEPWINIKNDMSSKPFSLYLKKLKMFLA